MQDPLGDQDTALGHAEGACFHYILEEGSNPRTSSSKDHFVTLVLKLAASLMGAKVPEVKADCKEQDPVDFDATLY